MAEARKASARGAKGVKGVRSPQRADLVEMAAVAADAAHSIADPVPAPQVPALPSQPAGETGALFFTVREQGDALRRAVREAVSVSAQGALEVNDKIIDALHVQSHMALDLWRTAITATDLPQALRAQTSATRQAYESASAQWQEVARTTARWMTRSFEPLQSALQRQA